MKPKKILITGATGFVGSNLVRVFLNEKHEIHIFVRDNSNTWTLGKSLKKVVTHKVDIENSAKVKTVLREVKPNFLLHLANLGVYGGEETNVSNYIKVNVIGTVNLISAIKHSNFELFINTGSSAEYGPKTKPMNEQDSCIPTTFYGVSKLTATYYSKLIAKQTGLPICTLRLFSPYGPNDNKNRLIPYTILKALSNRVVKIHDRNAVRDYLYIEDVTNAYQKAMQAKLKIRGETINIGSGYQISVAEIVSTIINLANSKSRVILPRSTSRPYESVTWQADIKKAKKYLNWKPQFTLEEGLSQTIKWFKNNKSHYQI